MPTLLLVWINTSSYWMSGQSVKYRDAYCPGELWRRRHEYRHGLKRLTRNSHRMRKAYSYLGSKVHFNPQIPKAHLFAKLPCLSVSLRMFLLHLNFDNTGSKCDNSFDSFTHLTTNLLVSNILTCFEFADQRIPYWKKQPTNQQVNKNKTTIATTKVVKHNMQL